jgi:chemotaxis protein methyltransferase CheR
LSRSIVLTAGRKPLLTPNGVPVLLSSIIHERTGIFFETDRHDVLLEKLEPLAQDRGCYSFLDYYYLLKFEENGVEDWHRVMDALAEAGWIDHPIEIRGSDASLSALTKARRGVYRQNSFRAMPVEIRKKYFSIHPEGWQLAPEIVQRVTFERANLMATEQINDLARASVIFCRNVFIYFSSHAIRQTVATFASRMAPKGHLFLGAAESLLKLTADFALREIGGACVYVRI